MSNNVTPQQYAVMQAQIAQLQQQLAAAGGAGPPATWQNATVALAMGIVAPLVKNTNATRYVQAAPKPTKDNPQGLPFICLDAIPDDLLALNPNSFNTDAKKVLVMLQATLQGIAAGRANP